MVKRIKTVNGYLNAVKRIEKNNVMSLKGYDSLTAKHQELLGVLSAEISNVLGEIKEEAMI